MSSLFVPPPQEPQARNLSWAARWRLARAKRRAFREQRRELRDQKRGFTVGNRKLLGGAWAVEITVVVAGTLSSVVFALRFSHGWVDFAQQLAPQLAFIAIEFSRIPLAQQLRSEASRLAKIAALAGLIGGVAITTKTMIQAVDAAFEFRFADVRHADDALESAVENLASVNATFEADTEAVKLANALVNKNIDRASAASNDLRSLPRVCDAKRHHCHADNRAKRIGGNLDGATGAAAKATNALNKANDALALVNPAQAREAVRAAELAKRDAMNASPFHLLAARVYGKPVSKIAESDMGLVMQVFITGASVVVAMMASIMAGCAAKPLPRPAPVRLRSPERIELLTAAANRLTEHASGEVEKKVATAFETAGAEAAKKPAPTNDNTPKSPLPKVLTEFVEKTKRGRGRPRKDKGNGAARPAKAAKPRKSRTPEAGNPPLEN